MENIQAQRGPAIDDLLIKIGVRANSVKPDIVGVAEQRVVPAVGLAAFGVVRVAPAQVPIPDRPHPDFAVAILVHVVANANPIDIFGVFDDPMVIHQRAGIDVRRVADA